MVYQPTYHHRVPTTTSAGGFRSCNNKPHPSGPPLGYPTCSLLPALQKRLSDDFPPTHRGRVTNEPGLGNHMPPSLPPPPPPTSASPWQIPELPPRVFGQPRKPLSQPVAEDIDYTRMLGGTLQRPYSLSSPPQNFPLAAYLAESPPRNRNSPYSGNVTRSPPSLSLCSSWNSSPRGLASSSPGAVTRSSHPYTYFMDSSSFRCSSVPVEKREGESQTESGPSQPGLPPIVVACRGKKRIRREDESQAEPSSSQPSSPPSVPACPPQLQLAAVSPQIAKPPATLDPTVTFPRITEARLVPPETTMCFEAGVGSQPNEGMGIGLYDGDMGPSLFGGDIDLFDGGMGPGLFDGEVDGPSLLKSMGEEGWPYAADEICQNHVGDSYDEGELKLGEEVHVQEIDASWIGVSGA